MLSIFVIIKSSQQRFEKKYKTKIDRFYFMESFDVNSLKEHLESLSQLNQIAFDTFGNGVFIGITWDILDAQMEGKKELEIVEEGFKRRGFQTEIMIWEKKEVEGKKTYFNEMVMLGNFGSLAITRGIGMEENPSLLVVFYNGHGAIEKESLHLTPGFNSIGISFEKLESACNKLNCPYIIILDCCSSGHIRKKGNFPKYILTRGGPHESPLINDDSFATNIRKILIEYQEKEEELSLSSIGRFLFNLSVEGKLKTTPHLIATESQNDIIIPDFTRKNLYKKKSPESEIDCEIIITIMRKLSETEITQILEILLACSQRMKSEKVPITEKVIFMEWGTSIIVRIEARFAETLKCKFPEGISFCIMSKKRGDSFKGNVKKPFI